MYRIKIGNMYLRRLYLDDNAGAILNDYIDSIEIDSSEAQLFKDELVAHKTADNLYIVLGLRPVVEKVSDRNE